MSWPKNLTPAVLHSPNLRTHDQIEEMTYLLPAFIKSLLMKFSISCFNVLSVVSLYTGSRLLMMPMSIGIN